MKTRISHLLLVTVATAGLGLTATDAAAQRGEHGRSETAQGPKACVKGQAQLDRNTETAIAYYTLAFNDGMPEEAVDRYIGFDENGEKLYTQHNPFAADGPQAFIDFVNLFKGWYPEMHIEIVRTIAQCDLVMTHGHLTLFEGDLGTAAMDIFRFDETGRIVEHWDAVQDVHPDPANDNGMF